MQSSRSDRYISYKHLNSYKVESSQAKGLLLPEPAQWIKDPDYDIRIYAPDIHSGQYLNYDTKEKVSQLFASGFKPYLILEEKTCRYCAGQMNCFKAGSGGGCKFRSNFLGVCPNCKWWSYVRTRNGWDVEGTYSEFLEGIIHKFDSEHTSIPVSVLIEEIRRKRLDLTTVKPKDLEIIVGAVVRDTMGLDSFYVGGPRDGGVDVFVTTGQAPIAIQVKRRGPHAAAESVSTIREFVGAMVTTGNYRGIVATTAERFSDAASNLAVSHRLKKMGIEIDLYHYDRLCELIETRNQDRREAWHECVRRATTPDWHFVRGTRSAALTELEEELSALSGRK